MVTLIYKFDECILSYIANNMHNQILDKIMIAFTSLGNTGLIWIAISLALIVSKKYRKVGIMVLTAIIIGSVFGEGLIKHIVKRTRPFYLDPTIKLLVAKPASYSFPSGHTTASFAAASILSRYFKKYAPVFFTVAILIAFSRIYLYVHYPTDVLAGIVLGLVSGKITIYLFKRIRSYLLKELKSSI
ncbi:phosphatase PAP2 family protein [Clostridium sp. 001]|uniref:phosphatase PAP2 family protein n=1 Tax=Clostridium sp. 001 TaxID=1970093 RepID=UPI001C2BB4DF|nr:phosphatase PAP2 family protein [Clostridium sp. 001]QXE18341.1 phosphatase PAP2 family protein [Clostridium sp. 001]